jgi:hypothetical protein
MKSIQQMITKSEKQRKDDAETFKGLDEDICMLCHAKGEDKRSLFINCFYDIKEVIPEALDLTDNYFLRICKSCRGELLGKLKEWRNEMIYRRELPKDSDGNPEETDPEKNIPIRINGAIRLITREEFDNLKKII